MPPDEALSARMVEPHVRPLYFRVTERAALEGGVELIHEAPHRHSSADAAPLCRSAPSDEPIPLH